MALWVIRILFLCLCTVAGYAISQVRPEFVSHNYGGALGMVIGFGFGWLMIAIDELVKGFSLRAFSATTFGLILGTVVALLIEANFIEGLIIVPRFVLKELQQIADSNDSIKRARGRRGLEMLNRIQHNPRNEVKIHEGDFPEEDDVDAKLVHLARILGAKLYTNDFNLGKVAELQSVKYVNLHDVAKSMRTILIPGEQLSLRLVREGKDKGQGVGYLPDGTMVVVNNAQAAVGRQVEVQVQSLLQTGAGVIVFADLRQSLAA